MRIRTLIFLVLVILPCMANAAATSETEALFRLSQDRNTAPNQDYAWTQPYCLRYFSSHPNLLIIGDSIFDGWSGYLLHVFPRALVDARVSRQFFQGILVYRNLLHYSDIRKTRTVVVELGTNGPVTARQVEQFMNLAGPNRRVIFIVPEVPRPWAYEVQKLYYSLPSRYPNLRLEYWNRISSLSDGKENPAYFWPDGVHPNWDGIEALVHGLQMTLYTYYENEGYHYRSSR